MYRIGIDLGGTNIVVGAVDEAGSIAASANAPTRADRGVDALLDDVAQCVMNCLNFGGILPEECLGTGIGCPGGCDATTGVVRFAPNLGWFDVPVCAELGKRLQMQVSLANDADCAALGEVAYGAAKGRSSALLITLGTGVGGGLVLDGKIFSGYRGRGGEFGHMCIDPEGQLCGCGRRGCWEAYASATALIRQARDAGLSLPELNGRSIYAAARAGDKTALAVTAKYAEYVALGLTNLINALCPEVVLLGGGVAGAGEALFAPVRAAVAARAFLKDPALLPEILPAALGGNAGVIGAAALV